MTEEKQKIPELNVIPAEELLDTTYAPSGTLVDGLMGQGIYILAGAPKVGKSWLGLCWATSVSARPDRSSITTPATMRRSAP